MGKIAVLDDNMINMIAAGEVIERPASVLKELLENSIDSGASRIIVRIEDGGTKLVSVTDDGCGMDLEDMGKAFLPHATSKIKSSDDLSLISTMGFRGEALASIASVSQVSIVSRTIDSIHAHKLEIDSGKFSSIAPCSGDYGTTIEVRNLFCKLPARRKFMRTTNTEMSHISEHFTRIALAHGDLDLTLIHNNRTVHRLVSPQSTKERIRQLLGKGYAEDLIETQRQERGIEIKALMGRPAAARATGKYQYIFLNGRYIRDKFITHAVKEAYRGLIEPNKYPMVFLYMKMPADQFDVNVHPTKAEVRFTNANLVHSQVLAVLREKLLSTDLDVPGSVPSARIPIVETEEYPADEKARRQRLSDAMESFFKNSPAAHQQKMNFSGNVSTSIPCSFRKSSPVDSEPYKPAFTNGTNHPVHQADEVTADYTIFAGQGCQYMQIHNSYILMQSPDGFDVIDQHALHERIIYEDLCRRLEQGGLSSQRLLLPETFTVSDRQVEILDKHADLLDKLGIEIAPFGPGTMAVQSFPGILKKVEPGKFVQNMLDLLTDDKTVDAEKLIHEVLDMAACKAAVKAGQPLSQQEMAELLKDKDLVKRTSRCPHGRPTTIKFALSDLEKQFKRTGF